MNDEFLRKLYALLKDYSADIDSDHMGDITLTVDNKIVGYWRGLISAEQWVDF